MWGKLPPQLARCADALKSPEDRAHPRSGGSRRASADRNFACAGEVRTAQILDPDRWPLPAPDGLFSPLRAAAIDGSYRAHDGLVFHIEPLLRFTHRGKTAARCPEGSMRVENHAGGAPRARKLHPAPIRIMHWINAVAIFIMIGSGWKIYNDEVIFGWLHFPEALTIGHWAQHGLQWHFFGMWVFVLNGIAYITYGLVTGRFRRVLLPIRWRELVGTVKIRCGCISRMTTSRNTTQCRSSFISA